MYNELYHHGIPGMKWGIRRYQNKDGSLTKLGRKRMAQLDSQQSKLEQKRKEIFGTAKVEKPKKVSEMTDEELIKANNRMQAEINYATNYARLYPRKKSLKESASEILKESGKKAIRDISDKAVQYAGRQVVKKLVGSQTYSEMFGNGKKEKKEKE